MSFPPGTEMFQFPGFASPTYGFSRRYPPCGGWVAPFGYPRITGCSPLPAAYRSVPRPSSPLGAKASTTCPYETLDRSAAYSASTARRGHFPGSLQARITPDPDRTRSTSLLPRPRPAAWPGWPEGRDQGSGIRSQESDAGSQRHAPPSDHQSLTTACSHRSRGARIRP